jgi:UDP-glucose 4-epimerase
MRYLITGGAGFIGSHLVDALTSRGDDVLVLDDLSTGRLENIARLNDSSHVDLVHGSVLDKALVDDCMSQVDACFHLASVVGVQLVVDRLLDTLHCNVHGTENVFMAASRYDRPVLYTSTSEVYGKNSDAALSEGSDRVLGSPFKSRWGYSISKAYGESLAHALHRERGARISVVRLFNTVGPRQSGAYGMVLPRFVRQALAGDDLTVFGTGTQSRCFVHVLDTVHALVLVAESDAAVGQVLNIGASSETAIIELAGRVIERAGSTSKVELVPYSAAYGDGFEELGRRRPDTSALEALTGWRPSRTLDEAIDDVIAHERSRMDVHASSVGVSA